MSVKIPKPVTVGLALLCALSAALLFMSGTALAAASEEPVTGKAEPVTNTTAVLHGTVNPKAKVTVAWFFEYNQGGACTGGGTTPVHPAEEVEARPAEAYLSGLQPGTQYTFCLVARNEAEEGTGGKSVSFTTTAVAPAVAEESFSNVTSTEATLSAQINAEGSPTTYKVEFGTSEPYASSAETSVGAAGGAVDVQEQLSKLEPGTVYHFRFVATNAFGSTPGVATEPFTTAQSLGPSELVLPDNRAYELVSPDASQEVYVPEKAGNAPEDIKTARPFRASADGNAVAYPISEKGADNVWVQPLDGSPGRQITKFDSEQILSFHWSPDGKSLGVLRGHTDSDVVLLQEAKP